MKTTELISLKKLTPLADAVGYVEQKALLGNSLYRLGGGLYFYLTKFGAPGVQSQGPFVVGLFCAPDDDAVLRATASRLESDSGSVLEPPAGLLPPQLHLEYGSLLSWLRSMQPKVCQESASYRIASDGLFIHRTIETEKYTFYFRGAAHDDHERPYAILLKY